MLPWRLIADPNGYIFKWLLGYSGGLGSIAGVLIADYWIVRQKRRSTSRPLPAGRRLRRLEPPAVVATLVGCGLAWGGLVIPPLRPLYDYAWFVGFFAAGGLYVALMSGKRNATPRSGR